MAIFREMMTFIHYQRRIQDLTGGQLPGGGGGGGAPTYDLAKFPRKLLEIILWFVNQ